MGRHARGVPAHRAAPGPRRRRGHRAQPSVLRHVARERWASCRASCTRTRASSTVSSRSSTSTAASRTRADGQWLARPGRRRRRGILLAHHGAIVTAPTIADACYKAATFERMCRFTYDILAVGPRRRSRSRPSNARALKPALAAEHAARVLGRRGATAARARTGGARRDRHVDRRPREREPRSAAARAGASRSRGCPNPSRASARYTVISVDDHVVEPPDAFTGRFPTQVRRRGAAHRPDRRRRRGVGLAGPGAAERRLQRGGRPAVDRVRLRADALRRDAARRVGRGRARRRHGHRRRVRRRCASRRSCPASSASGSRCGRTTTSSRSSRCARTTTGTSKRGAARIPVASSRTRSRTCAIPRSRPQEIRRNAARGFKAVTFSEAPDKLGLPTIHSGYWDPLFARVRGDRDRAVPARRLVGHVADDLAPTRRPRSPRCCSARTACTARSTGSTRRSRCASPTSRSACRKAASAGSPASWTGSTTATSTSSATCRRGATSTSRRARCCAATSGSARSTTTPGMRVRDRIGVDHILVESDYPHADSSWPDTQAMLVRQLDDQGVARRRRRAASPGRTRRSCSGTRSRPNCSADADARSARCQRVGSSSGTTSTRA